jgi:hypothetical protein
MTAHSQIADVVDEDHSRHAAWVGRFAQKRAHHYVGTTRLVDYCGAKAIMLVAKALQPFG